jgi:putative ABC transport system ATP-binding protein
MNDIAVQAVDVSKYYETGNGRVVALDRINLSIMRGEYVSITGPSGSGKSTLLNCLSGLDRVSEGHVYVNGTDIATMNDREISVFRSKNMGFIFQNYALIPVFTALENVELPALVSGVTAQEANKRALEALELVGLLHRANFRPSQLSGGEQQRVAVARAIVNRPSVIWADEPTGNLDTETGASILRLFDSLNRERGSTLVVVTHDERVARSARRRISLLDGRITGDGK